MAKKKVEVEKSTEQSIDGYYVIAPFKDKKQYGSESYSIGDDVSHFETERLKKAIELGLIEFRENKVEQTED